VRYFPKTQTEKPPGTYAEARLGQAIHLGRRAIVRIDPGASESRTLLHEILHLYGAVHVAESVDSLMNPGGNSTEMDPMNGSILAVTRERQFASDSMEQNLFARVDEHELIDVYIEVLRVNLGLRRRGLDEASRASRESRYTAQDIAENAMQLDDELARVAMLLSNLYLRDAFYAKAAEYCDLAARLFGMDRARGRQQRARAEKLRQISVSTYGKGNPSPIRY
jgi:hypothetical protein